MKLQPIPPAPSGVKYALTVPQSVLFADLSLQGNLRSNFRQTMQINYEPAYILIDAGGAMSWNYDSDSDFAEALGKESSIADKVAHFVATMERTARQLNKVSKLVGSPGLRNGRQDILEDLELYWGAYRAHMTSLFTFWNVEQLLSQALTEELEKAGLHGEIRQGLARFLKPNEPNYFVLERLQLQKIARRFSPNGSLTRKNASTELIAALKTHRSTYGFLLAPFNLGAPPSIDSLLERLKETPRHEAKLSGFGLDTFDNLPPTAKQLAVLTQQMAFWKTERLDMFALADARARPLYAEAANALALPLIRLFATTSSEIARSLRQGKPMTDTATLKQRQKAYCLALVKGKVDFFAPTTTVASGQATQQEAASVIQGVCASAGKVTGTVRVIKTKKDLAALKKGEILITKMTRPEYGAALDRAAAFVTDEGGMMCHAAIISREMKKPCIIGTGNATEMLQTGTTIEVDADNATVTTLESS